MISATAMDFIKWGMSDLGILEPGEEPEESEPQDGLDLLNQMIDDWKTEFGTKNFVQRFLGNLANGVSTYTIGSGATFDVDRPVTIEFCSIIPDRTATNPIELRIGRPLSVQAYAGIVQKSATALYPDRVYYDHQFTALGYGNIIVYPVPTASVAQVVLYLPTGISQFADLTTSYAFPPGYAKAIRKNFALEAQDMFDAEASPRLVAAATKSLFRLKRANVNPNEATFDPALVGGAGRYNIYTDER